jgi:hypothetical protein
MTKPIGGPPPLPPGDSYDGPKERPDLTEKTEAILSGWKGTGQPISDPSDVIARLANLTPGAPPKTEVARPVPDTIDAKIQTAIRGVAMGLAPSDAIDVIRGNDE